jgi:hypothetical protein
MVTVKGTTYWTVREIADQAGVPPEQVYRWLRGQAVPRCLRSERITYKHHIADEEWRAFARLIGKGSGVVFIPPHL